MFMIICVIFFLKCISMRVRDIEREGEKEIGWRSSFFDKKKKFYRIEFISMR